MDDPRGRSAAAAFWSPAPVHGYRVWRIHAWVLTGARMAWHAPAMTAMCLSTGATAGVPHWQGECGQPGCGVYARRTLAGIRGLRPAASAPGMVAGLVALTGTVVEHEHGFRAEHCEVVAAGSLWGDRLIVSRDSRWLAALFADPVATLSRAGTAPQISATGRRGGRVASLAILADRLEEIGAEVSGFDQSEEE